MSYAAGNLSAYAHGTMLRITRDFFDNDLHHQPSDLMGPENGVTSAGCEYLDLLPSCSR